MHEPNVCNVGTLRQDNVQTSTLSAQHQPQELKRKSQAKTVPVPCSLAERAYAEGIDHERVKSSLRARQVLFTSLTAMHRPPCPAQLLQLCIKAIKYALLTLNEVPCSNLRACFINTSAGKVKTAGWLHHSHGTCASPHSGLLSTAQSSLSLQLGPSGVTAKKP